MAVFNYQDINIALSKGQVIYWKDFRIHGISGNKYLAEDRFGKQCSLDQNGVAYYSIENLTEKK